jgi:hypothetical protein
MSEKRPRSKSRVALIGVALVLVGVPLGLFFARHTIATSMARDELERRGLTCDDRLSVEVAASFDAITIGPTRCAVRAEGVVEAIEILGPLEVELDGLEPARVEVASLRIALREHDVRGGSGWALALARLGLEQRVAGLVKGLSELSRMDLPPSEAAQVEIVRGGGVLATGRGIALRPSVGAPLGLSAQHVELVAGPGGVGQLSLAEVRGTATGARVALSGTATATAGLGILSLSRAGPFAIEAVGLDSASPRFRLTGF